MEKYGYIYKITNKINKKIYIGQTQQTIEMRWSQHKSHAIKGNSQNKLGRAIRKYGVENFFIEKIEKCTLDKLDEREIYWIRFYDSVNSGYNILLGGQKKRTFKQLQNEEEIIKYYYTCHNQVQTIKHFGITDYKLRQLLLRNNLPTDYSNYGKHSCQGIKIIELNKIFSSETECAQYMIDNNYCKSKKLNCVKVHMSRCISEKKPIYNFHWQII